MLKRLKHDTNHNKELEPEKSETLRRKNRKEKQRKEK